MIRAARCADAYSEVELPIGGQVQIEIGEEIVLFLVQGEKCAEGTDTAVILEAGVDFFRDVVADLYIRRKNQSLMHRQSVKRTVQRRIEGHVPAADLFVDDRADFQSPRVGRIAAALVAEFEGDAGADR